MLGHVNAPFGEAVAGSIYLIMLGEPRLAYILNDGMCVSASHHKHML